MTFIIVVVIYGSEAWLLTKKIQEILRRFERKIVQHVLAQLKKIMSGE